MSRRVNRRWAKTHRKSSARRSFVWPGRRKILKNQQNDTEQNEVHGTQRARSHKTATVTRNVTFAGERTRGREERNAGRA